MLNKATKRAANYWFNFPGYEILAGEKHDVTREIIRRILTGEIPVPSKSPKQARTMRAAAHDPAFAKKIGIPQKVAREYVAADEKKTVKPARRK